MPPIPNSRSVGLRRVRRGQITFYGISVFSAAVVCLGVASGPRGYLRGKGECPSTPMALALAAPFGDGAKTWL